MKIAFAALVALAAAALAAPALAQDAPAAAQTGPQPMPGMPGYEQPAIGADACHNVDASHTQCTIPAKTSGRYLVIAIGTATATGAGAAQQLAIGGPTWVCARVTDNNNSKWSSGPRALKVECTVDVLTDQPLPITVEYRVTHATLDPKGPQMAIQRAGWSGVVTTSQVGAQAGVPKTQ
ncbi:MAG TPA: hypothetical protein VKU90_05470 [Caulobacteraceae bacterium]|nr:hypothetical protein [Caulobacteraceae bacterium]